MDRQLKQTALQVPVSHFRLVAQGVDVVGVNAELADHPEIWGARTYRTADPTSPHAVSRDVWLRYRKLEELTCPADYRTQHFAEFYPEWRLLPALHPIVYGLMSHLRAVYLGGILITEIPAGGRIATHNDRGSWHAEFMNTKLYLVVRDNPWCLNHCGGDTVHMREGDVWAFDNLVDHSVENNGPTVRQTVIISMRVEQDSRS